MEVQLGDHKMLNIKKAGLLALSASLCLQVACSGATDVDAVARVPASKFDLSHWSITMPLDMDGNDRADTIGVAEIQPYSHPDFFYLDENDHLVFTSPNKATTSPTSTNTRSELRYHHSLTADRNFALAAHKNAEQYASIGSRMEATLQVDHVSMNAGHPDKPPAYSVVIGQIHATSDGDKSEGFGYGNEPLKIFYKKWPHHETGSVFWAYERNLPTDDPNRTDIAYVVWGKNWDDPADPGASGIALGEVFSYIVNVYENTMYLVFESETKGTVRHEINLANNVDANGNVDSADHPLGYAGDPLYFKAGTYNQCSTSENESWRYPACPGTGVWETDKADGNYAKSTFHRLVVSEPSPM